eukprot:11008171-Lingulodinium_polyedra.AAC.1
MIISSPSPASMRSEMKNWHVQSTVAMNLVVFDKEGAQLASRGWRTSVRMLFSTPTSPGSVTVLA